MTAIFAPGLGKKALIELVAEHTLRSAVQGWITLAHSVTRR